LPPFLLSLALDQGAKLLSFNLNFPFERNYSLILGFLPNNFIFFLLFFLFVLSLGRLGIDYFSLGLLFGGGVSNLIDRIRLGYVLDNLPFFSFFWFNLADLFILFSILISAKKRFLQNKV